LQEFSNPKRASVFQIPASAKNGLLSKPFKKFAFLQPVLN
jgi:hypothetical protein